jgi:hypothetical protein
MRRATSPQPNNDRTGGTSFVQVRALISQLFANSFNLAASCMILAAPLDRDFGALGDPGSDTAGLCVSPEGAAVLDGPEASVLLLVDGLGMAKAESSSSRSRSRFSSCS